jgi:hypothetical protein
MRSVTLCPGIIPSSANPVFLTLAQQYFKELKWVDKTQKNIDSRLNERQKEEK